MIKLNHIILGFALVFFSIGFGEVFLDAIAREQAFNESVRAERCSRHWIDGYCDGFQMQWVKK